MSIVRRRFAASFFSTWETTTNPKLAILWLLSSRFITSSFISKIIIWRLFLSDFTDVSIYPLNFVNVYEMSNTVWSKLVMKSAALKSSLYFFFFFLLSFFSVNRELQVDNIIPLFMTYSLIPHPTPHPYCLKFVGSYIEVRYTCLWLLSEISLIEIYIKGALPVICLRYQVFKLFFHEMFPNFRFSWYLLKYFCWFSVESEHAFQI